MSNNNQAVEAAERLALAEKSGARITGKPDGSEPIEVVFTIDAWRKFSATLPSPVAEVAAPVGDAWSDELKHRIYNTLMHYANTTTYDAPRIGGVLQGCPRGAVPMPDELTRSAILMLGQIETAMGRVPPQWMEVAASRAPVAVVAEPRVEIVAQEPDSFEAKYTVLEPQEYSITATRDDEFSNWSIEVRHPDGGHLYDGYWRDSVDKTMTEVIAEALHGAMLPHPAPAQKVVPVAEPVKWWLWKNFVDGRPEYWAFDNAYPINLYNGDPQTLGEPCGYAILKPSRQGRTDVSGEQVLHSISIAAAPSPEIAQLMKFYGTDTLEAVVLAQNRQIEGLQARLPRDNTPMFQRVREG